METLQLIKEKKVYNIKDYDEVLCNNMNKFVSTKGSDSIYTIIVKLNYYSDDYDYFIGESYQGDHDIFRNRKR